MSRLSGPERGEQNLANVRSYLAGLQAAGQSLPLEDGHPNISAIAEAAGVLRNVFYTNSGVKKLLAEFVGGPALVADGSAALSRAQHQAEAKDLSLDIEVSSLTRYFQGGLANEISQCDEDFAGGSIGCRHSGLE